jgi:acyl-CoA thioester hydrolase
MSAAPLAAPRRCLVDLEVRYAETDQMGVVHHANYLVWFELARTRLCAEAGLHYAEIERAGYYMMVTEAEVSYRRGARYGDRVGVTTWLAELGSRFTSFGYEIHRDGQLLATGRTRHVWVRAEDSRPCRLPAMARSCFERLAGASS